MKYVPNFLGTSKGDATSGNVSWSPKGYGHDRTTNARSRYSRAADKTTTSQSGGRSTDAQYGLSILKTSSYDVETSSQEAIVPKKNGTQVRSESETCQSPL